MAAIPFNTSGPGSSFLFPIFNDDQLVRSSPALPSGRCKYTLPSQPDWRCGCVRFWRRGHDNPDGATCSCSHHACFHEDVQPGELFQPVAPTNVVGQENQRPRTNREPLSPVVGLESFQMGSGFGNSMDIARLLNLQSMASTHVDAEPPFQAEDAQSRPDTAIPDTLPWENLFQADGGEREALPPIPSQCSMLPTQPNSVASSSQSRYLKPFAGKGLHTLSVVEEPADEAGDAQATSAPANEDHGPARPALADMGVSAEKWHELSNTVNSHEHRLERLENASISVAGHDDCYEKVDSIDCRVVDLAERLEEVEKIVKDNSSTTTTASVASVETDATVLGPNRGAIYTRLQSLEAQVSKLQSSLPTYNNPWRLEVIFLPYPLKGVWIEGREWPNQRSATGTNVDEWTQMPNTMSRATPDPHEWHSQFADSNWMFPKAFVAGKTIDKRLRSRGLVQTIEVRGSDARSVNIAIEKAFGDVLQISNAHGGQCYSSDVSVFLGLQHAWVPLRKLHKDSRLRFLARSEMTTPSLWDYNFLCASVVMKASGTPRLYITQPEAYLQDHPQGLAALESGWTWSKVRQLDRVWPDSQSSVDAFVPEGDAREECWAEDTNLDAPPSVNSSALSLRHHRQRRASRGLSATPSEQFYTGVQSLIPSNSALFGRAQSPLTQREHYGSRPHNVRTSSLPQATGAIPSPSQSRRRFSAHISTATPYERRSSPLITRPSPRVQAQNYIPSPITTGPSANVYKRRYASRDPSLQPRSNTPRYSRTSMSRSPSLAPEGFHGFPNNRERHTTPFYATPFSEPSRYTQRGSSRPPAPPRPSDGYDPDDEEMTDDFGYDQSSSSDGQYGNEMGSDSSGSTSHPHQNDSQEIAVYQDNVDELDDVDTDPGYDLPSWSRFEPPLHENQPQNILPQDIPWPGFEDEDHMSDGENVDPESGSGSQSHEIIIHEDEDVDLLDRQDDEGDASGPDSQAPSEYSSKPGAWPATLASVSASASVSGAGRAGAGAHAPQQESQGVQIYEDGSGPETRWA